MARKHKYIYRIARNYTPCRIYWGSNSYHNLLGTTTITPNKRLTRRERYDVIAADLYAQTGFPAPSYRPAKYERQRSDGK